MVHTDTTNDTITTTVMDTTTPALIPAAPSLACHLCEVSFNSAEEKRLHAKSASHVDKIRSKAINSVDPDAVPSQTLKAPRKQAHRAWETRPKSPSDNEDDSDLATESESDNSPTQEEAPSFIPEQCLFCNHSSPNFEENLSHMHQTHSLAIPFQSALAVDLQTLIWYLHLVIFTYRECISCARRRRTVEAIQQHMTSSGHCRFDMNEDMGNFYDSELLKQQRAEDRIHPDERTLRLPSGKLLGHRSYSDSTMKNKLREKSGSRESQGALPSSSQGSTSATSNPHQALTKKDRKEQALSTQFFQLSANDQMSLSHLPQSQQRSLLLVQKKESDKAKRAERRQRRRLDKVGDKVAVHTNYYKQEVPVYMGG